MTFIRYEQSFEGYIGKLSDNFYFQGVGMNTNDPYENFRKNRSNNFIVRMKSRGEDKN